MYAWFIKLLIKAWWKSCLLCLVGVPGQVIVWCWVTIVKRLKIVESIAGKDLIIPSQSFKQPWISRKICLNAQSLQAYVESFLFWNIVVPLLTSMITFALWGLTHRVFEICNERVTESLFCHLNNCETQYVMQDLPLLTEFRLVFGQELSPNGVRHIGELTTLKILSLINFGRLDDVTIHSLAPLAQLVDLRIQVIK